jgi:hypothetical protein
MYCIPVPKIILIHIFIRMFSSSDDWENGMLGEDEASVEDDIKGTSELFLAKRTAKVHLSSEMA